MNNSEAQLIGAVESKLGPKVVITDPREIEPWVTDWRGRVHGASPAILAPGSTAEVVQIVELAAEHRVPLVPQVTVPLATPWQYWVTELFQPLPPTWLKKSCCRAASPEGSLLSHWLPQYTR